MKKIAVVEDNPDNRLLVRVMLESLYELTEYDSGFAALAGLPKQVPDLVLLDISLPELDGGEVLRRIRADPALRHLPVIALTAHAMAGDREKYLAAGFNDYVAKPIVEEQVLLSAIERQLPAASRLSATGKSPEAPSPPPRASLLQRSSVCAMDRLRHLGGDQFAADMVRLFLEYGQAKMSEARQAFVAGDMAEIAKAVHPLRSSAANVGADRVNELATLLEEVAGTHAPPGVLSNPAPPPGGLPDAATEQIADIKGLLGQLEAAFAEVKAEFTLSRK